ncbi:hypothetical protein [Persephonella sp.]
MKKTILTIIPALLIFTGSSQATMPYKLQAEKDIFKNLKEEREKNVECYEQMTNILYTMKTYFPSLFVVNKTILTFLKMDGLSGCELLEYLKRGQPKHEEKK